jgi:hypothetical protein
VKIPITPRFCIKKLPGHSQEIKDTRGQKEHEEEEKYSTTTIKNTQRQIQSMIKHNTWTVE